MAVVKKDSHFIVVNKKAYNRIEDRIYKKIMAAEIAFYRSVPQLRPLNKRVLMKIWTHMKYKKFHRNQLVIKEGEQPKFVYIIKSGEFVVKKHVFKRKLTDL